MSEQPRLVGLSVDVDSVASHLQGYGIDGVDDDGSAYEVAIPRALDLFESHGCTATFFLVAREARRHAEVVREIVVRGHEVGSHSMTHELPLGGRGADHLAMEVGGSKRVLEDLTGRTVSGFRAPSWDASPRVLQAVLASGYTYDASAFPSILLPLMRRSVARRSEQGRSRTAIGLMEGMWGPTGPYLRRVVGGVLPEVPIGTTPFARLPFYHTLRFLLPGPAFRILGAAAQARRGAISYAFHAVDFLGLSEDGLDRRIARHPGMNVALEAKLTMAREVLDWLARRRRGVSIGHVVRTSGLPAAQVLSRRARPGPRRTGHDLSGVPPEPGRIPEG